MAVFGVNTGNFGDAIKQYWAQEVLLPIYPYLVDSTFCRDISSMFPNGDKFYLNLMGQGMLYTRNSETEEMKFDSPDISQIEVNITEFPYMASAISKKFREDTYQFPQVISGLGRDQQNQIKNYVEARMFITANESQTSGDSNLINGAAHRIIASDPTKIQLADFETMGLAFDRANLPPTGRVAFISSQMAQQLRSQISTVNVTFNRMFDGIPAMNTKQGSNVTFSINGFDVYVSEFLDTVASETIDSVTVTNARAAIFMCVADDNLKPMVRAWRRMPTTATHIDFKRDDLLLIKTDARFGYQIQRPQSLGVVLAKSI